MVLCIVSPVRRSSGNGSKLSEASGKRRFGCGCAAMILFHFKFPYLEMHVLQDTGDSTQSLRVSDLMTGLDIAERIPKNINII
jgi:hypothetical protein